MGLVAFSVFQLWSHPMRISWMRTPHESLAACTFRLGVVRSHKWDNDDSDCQLCILFMVENSLIYIKSRKIYIFKISCAFGQKIKYKRILNSITFIYWKTCRQRTALSEFVRTSLGFAGIKNILTIQIPRTAIKHLHGHCDP